MMQRRCLLAIVLSGLMVLGGSAQTPQTPTVGAGAVWPRPVRSYHRAEMAFGARLLGPGPLVYSWVGAAIDSGSAFEFDRG